MIAATGAKNGCGWSSSRVGHQPGQPGGHRGLHDQEPVGPPPLDPTHHRVAAPPGGPSTQVVRAQRHGAESVHRPIMATPADPPDRSPVRMVNVSTIRVTVWGENYHEQAERDRAAMAERYPEGMHGAIAAGLRELLGDAVEVRTATRDQPEHGLTEDVLDNTDVLTWWGHARHAEIDDAVVDRVHRRVLGGMGLLVLHSAHFAKIFTRLMGTTCSLAWRNSADTELVWTVAPAHPIARGVPHPIVIDEQEMYGEYFDIPAPDELVFLSTFSSRRGLPIRLLLAPRQGPSLLLLAWRPGVPRLPPPRHPPGPGQRGAVGAARPGGRPRPTGRRRPAGPEVPGGSPGRRHERAAAARRGGRSGWAGQQHMAAYAELPGVDLVALAGRETDLAGGAGRAVRGAAGPALRRLAGPAGLGRPRRAQHRHADHPARPDRRRCAGCRGARAVGEAAGRERRGRRAHGRGGRAQPPRARRVVQPPPPRRGQGLKEIIDGGSLGPIYYAKVGWVRRQGIPTLGSWFTRRATAGGGPLMDLGVHMLDIVLYLLDEPTRAHRHRGYVRGVRAAAGLGASRRHQCAKTGVAEGVSTSRTCRPRSCDCPAG